MYAYAYLSGRIVSHEDTATSYDHISFPVCISTICRGGEERPGTVEISLENLRLILASIVSVP